MIRKDKNIELILGHGTQPITSATRQVRQQWFSLCIFPLKLFFGLIPMHRDNPPLRVASYVVGHIISPLETQSVFEKAFNLRGFRF